MSKEYRVRCKKLDGSGRGIVEFNGRKFAIKGLLPGELATMELVYRAKDTGAKLCKVLEPSSDRVEPACAVFDMCGGCQLLHMSGNAQKAFKQGLCEDLLGGFGKVRPILTAENPKNYRNKVHAAFARKRVGGAPGGKGNGAYKSGKCGPAEVRLFPVFLRKRVIASLKPPTVLFRISERRSTFVRCGS